MGATFLLDVSSGNLKQGKQVFGALELYSSGCSICLGVMIFSSLRYTKRRVAFT